jgi:transcriptional regulator with XRE-family HTH domain
MTFREKIDKILKTNTLQINSVYGLEVYIGASPGAINKYYKKNKEPGAGTIKKILDGVGIDPDWWERSSGDIYVVKPTQGIKSEQPDILDHPVVVSLKNEIRALNKVIEMQDAEILRLRGK